jgi:hypothetical protein
VQDLSGLKVAYSSKTKKYVCIFKLFLKGAGQAKGFNGVATSNSATEPFTYQGKFLAASETAGSEDFALFQDPVSGSLYNFTVRKSDRALVRAKMNDEHTAPAENYTVCKGVAISTEVPAMMYKSGTYHLFGSGSDGWKPTAPRYYTTTSVIGDWTVQTNPLTGTNPYTNEGANLTFGGQSANIIQIQGLENQYIMMMDVWRPLAPTTSPYIWLSFRLSNKKIKISWVNSWNLSWFNTN